MCSTTTSATSRPRAACTCSPSRSTSPPSATPSARCWRLRPADAPPRRRGQRGLAARVGVEAAPGLLAEAAGLDELDEDRRRRELVLPEPLVKHAHDPEADVEADEVGQLERTHRMVESDPGARVDVVGRPEALLVGPHRLAEERHQDPVDDEPRP